MRSRLLCIISGLAVAMWNVAANAADVETVVVTASALPGTAIDPNQIPANVQSFSGDDLARFGSANALSALNTQGAGVSLAEAQDNPLQPNFLYRGFEASPLAGDAQGLAVYVDGVRFNQPFGDVVNWDLIPDIAIDRLTLEGSNPVFGLNALGGSISVHMKDGFRFQGSEMEALGGSFGHVETSAQYGANDDRRSFYAAGTLLNDDGWRAHSPSHLVRGFTDLGWRGGNAELHLNVIDAATALTGNGVSPVQLLAVDRSAVFTFPDKTDNQFGLANLYGTISISPTVSLQGNAYVSRFSQRTRNGDASDAEPCDTNELCLDDGTVVTDAHGNPIPDFLGGGTYGQLDLAATDTTGFGGALQMADSGSLLGQNNQLLLGASYDGGRTNFSARSDLGRLTPARGYVGPNIMIDIANGEIAPVAVASDNDYYGLYIADAFDVTDALSLTASARFNAAGIALHDRLGNALNGSHRFTQFNPALGLTYKISGNATFYTGYSEANRAPTPAEFSCASPAAPCSLTNFFVGDPALKQVVAHTIEGGLRGDTQAGDASIRWHAGVYRVTADDDILFTASSVIGRGFFRNIGETRRQGVEASADLTQGPWTLSLNYALTEATFRTATTLSSPDNPRADDNGDIHVRPGANLPSIPRNTLKLLVGYQPVARWQFNLSARYADGSYLRGDESNLNPTTKAYIVLDAAATWRMTDTIELFADVDNLLDAKYATFGTFSPIEQVPIVQVLNADNPRSLSPGAPLAVSGGIRIRM